MPTLSVRDPRVEDGVTFLNPLQAGGRFGLDDPNHPHTITGTATYEFEGATKTVAGVRMLSASKVFWSMTFDIPDPRVTCDLEFVICDDETHVCSTPVTVTGVEMAAFRFYREYFTSANNPLPQNGVRIEFIGTDDPDVILVAGRARGAAGTKLYCQCVIVDAISGETYTAALVTPTPLPGNWWVATLPIPLALREYGMLEAFLTKADGRVIAPIHAVVIP
jgi:hypothetical protein